MPIEGTEHGSAISERPARVDDHVHPGSRPAAEDIAWIGLGVGALVLIAFIVWLARHSRSSPRIRAAQHLRSARVGRTSLRRTLVPALAAMVGFGVMIASIGTVPLPWRQVERLSAEGKTVNDAPAAQRFIEDQTSPGESILLFGREMDHRIAERAGVVNVSPWNSMFSLFSEREVDRALDATH